MVKVKICGLTNLEDATVAITAGADLLGFIFYPPSPRSIGVAEAQQLIRQLRQSNAQLPLLVGVFVNEPASRVAAILEECTLDLAQLSGDEVPSLIGEPTSPLYGRAFKVLRPTSIAEAEAEAEWYVPPNVGTVVAYPTLLLDARHPTLPGGTGRKADWRVAAHLAEKLPGLMLAGGLNPSNIVEAVEQVRPYAVDVASGVERSPGRKDHDKVRTFIQRARSVIY